MSEIFISYSRKDKDFVIRLHKALEAKKRDDWVDLEDIRPTAEWSVEIRQGIEGARAFVFVLSPDSMASPECLKELNFAVASHKRLIPVVCREVDSHAVPEPLSRLHWIFLQEQDDFVKGIDTLLTAVDTDLEWVDAHTILLGKASEWDRQGRKQSLLLRGDVLQEAVMRLDLNAGKEPRMNDLVLSYIRASQEDESKQQKRSMWTKGTVSLVLIALFGVAVLTMVAKSRLSGEYSVARTSYEKEKEEERQFLRGSKMFRERIINEGAGKRYDSRD